MISCREISAPRYSDGAAHYDMGEHTLRIPMSLHRTNRQRLLARLSELQKAGTLKQDSVVLLQGGSDVSRDSADTSWIFRQVGGSRYLIDIFPVLDPLWQYLEQ